MKSKMLEGGKILIVILIGIIVGFLLMMLAYTLPVERMKGHLEESASMLEEEGDYPAWAKDYTFTQGDQFTDAIMLKAATIDTEGSIVEKALLIPYYDSFPETQTIRETTKREKATEYKKYARYWNGYLVFLKPLLLFFNVSEIRILSMFCLSFLVFIALWLIGRRFSLYYVLVLLLSVLMISPISIILSMQYKDVFYIAMISVILLLMMNDQTLKSKGKYVFLLNGMCVAFFDFLTYPLYALCIPITVYFLLNREKTIEQIKRLIGLSVVWGIGYGGMWGGKWLLANLLTKENIIANALERTSYRSSNLIDGNAVNLIDTIGRSLSVYNNHAILAVLLAAVITITVYMVRRRKTLKVSERVIPIAIICILPFIWYMVTINHSYIHIHLAYRELGGTIFSLLCGIGIISNAAARKDEPLRLI